MFQERDFTKPVKNVIGLRSDSDGAYQLMPVNAFVQRRDDWFRARIVAKQSESHVCRSLPFAAEFQGLVDQIVRLIMMTYRQAREMLISTSQSRPVYFHFAHRTCRPPVQ